MKSITITGKFSKQVNNYIRLDVYASNPAPYDFSKSYDGDFSESISDLKDDSAYLIDFTGITFGDFDLEISGEIISPNPIKGHFKKTDFKPGYAIKTNP